MIKNRAFEKSFNSYKELFHALKDNESFLLDQKKNSEYKSINKSQGVKNIPLKFDLMQDKSFYKSNFIYPVINSTGWLDSHDDVHIKGCYDNTVKHQQGKIYYIDSHLKGLTNIISKKKDIVTHIKDIPWTMLGKTLEGETQSLVLEIAEDKVKPEYLDLIKSDPDLENSFAMRYIKIHLAIDTKDSGMKENKEAFDYYVQGIANKDLAETNKMFFAVEELAIMGEGSLCPVIGGSNSATRVITNENKSTQVDNSNKGVTHGNSANLLLI